MSKESIRKNIEKLKNESELILESKSLNKDIRLFINSMMTILDIIVIAFLEKKTRKNSSNSGLPPSRNNGPNGNRNTNQGDRSKKGEQLKNTRKVNTIESVSPDDCASCGSDLRNIKAHNKEERTILDIIYETTEHTVISEHKECPDCGQINKGKFPEGMDGKIQYGMGIKASIIDFLMVQMVSLERVQEHFKGLIGRFISQAIMLKYMNTN